MPKKINDTIGHCLCRRCKEETADIRRYKNHERGARYLVCPECGVDRVNGAKAQQRLDEWIDANTGKAMTERGPDIPELEPKLETVPAPVPARPGPKPGRNFFQRIHDEVIAIFQE